MKVFLRMLVAVFFYGVSTAMATVGLYALFTSPTVSGSPLLDAAVAVALVFIVAFAVWGNMRERTERFERMAAVMIEARNRALHEMAEMQTKHDSDVALHDDAVKAWEKRKAEIAELEVERNNLRDAYFLIDDQCKSLFVEKQELEQAVTTLKAEVSAQRETNNSLSELCERQRQEIERMREGEDGIPDVLMGTPVQVDDEWIEDGVRPLASDARIHPDEIAAARAANDTPPQVGNTQ